MFKKAVGLVLAIFFFLLFAHITFASEQFKTDATTTYRVMPDGIVEVQENIKIENLVSDIYASSFGIELDNITPINPRAKQDGKSIPIEKSTEGTKTILSLNFEDALVGKGKIRNFDIVFSENSFATRTGEIWEIAIPRLSDEANFDSYSLFLIVPESFGQEAYISPKPQSVIVSEGERVYAFSESSVSETGITAGFGLFQVFSYQLNYHLENPISKTAEVSIAIPPDTAFQKVYISTIEPKPNEVSMDLDGNWMASYALAAKQRVDVSVKGAVQIFASPRPFFKPPPQVLDENLKPSEFWQVDEPKIKGLAEKLKTAEEIYNYVSKTLTYDYERVKPNVTRLGALAVLENPTQAICMEYTDLFIAIARAAGIPAREVNGYAYSENPDIQPLSLVADVLHSWPEYYDFKKAAWIPVDPTWGSTTGGIDFFNKLDLRHFTFVNHGVDPTKPYPPGSYKLGPNPQKDVFVNFGQLPEKRISTPEIKLEAKSLSFLKRSFSIVIENKGPAAIYDTSYHILFDKSEVKSERLDVLLPFSKVETQISLPFSFLAKNAPSSLVVEVSGSRAEAPINKTQIVVTQLILLFIGTIVFIAAIIMRLKKISLAFLVLSIIKRIIDYKNTLVNAIKTKIFKKSQPFN